MADWSGVTTDPSQINGGKEYEAQKDRVSIEAFNAIVNNSIYASNASAEALEKAESAFQGNGTIVRVNGAGKGYVDFESDPQSQLNSKESIELIYDNSSNDININWSQTGGIYSGTTISGKDFSKYKKLRCLYGGTSYSVIEVDLTKQFNGVYEASNVHYVNYVGGLGNFWGEIQVNAEKTTLKFNGGLLTAVGTSDTYAWVFKIEGVY